MAKRTPGIAGNFGQPVRFTRLLTIVNNLIKYRKGGDSFEEEKA